MTLWRRSRFCIHGCTQLLSIRYKTYNKKEGSTALVLPSSLFCFRFKNERRIFFSCPQTFLHFVPTLQCQICGFVFGATAPSAIRTIRRIKLHTCVKAARYFQLWHTIINRIGNIGFMVNTHARYNFLYSHIYLHLPAPVKRCCPFYCNFQFVVLLFENIRHLILFQ